MAVGKGATVDGLVLLLPTNLLVIHLISATSSVYRTTGEESYVAVDKGAIVDGHVLVLPIEHYPNSLGLPPGAHAEMDRYLSALQSCYAAQVNIMRICDDHSHQPQVTHCECFSLTAWASRPVRTRKWSAGPVHAAVRLDVPGEC